MNKTFYFCNKCSNIIDTKPDKLCNICRLKLAVWLMKVPKKERDAWLNKLKQNMGDADGKKKK